MPKRKKYVLVTDIHRGVYMGYLVEIKNKGRTVKLEEMRHIFYMKAGQDNKNKGVYALATIGPPPGSHVGPAVTAIIHDVAKVVDATETARKRAEKATWDTK